MISDLNGSLGYRHFLFVMNERTSFAGYNVRVSGIQSVFSFSAICNADRRSVCWARWWPA